LKVKSLSIYALTLATVDLFYMYLQFESKSIPIDKEMQVTIEFRILTTFCQWHPIPPSPNLRIVNFPNKTEKSLIVCGVKPLAHLNTVTLRWWKRFEELKNWLRSIVAEWSLRKL
jgi:hypothetical protein